MRHCLWRAEFGLDRIQTRAQLNYSQANMTYARIFAPIDGLVVSRNVDPGQTVAASFQSPTLFVIAQDLRKMRILAEIDEAAIAAFFSPRWPADQHPLRNLESLYG